jgi:hypothetical protein
MPLAHLRPRVPPQSGLATPNVIILDSSEVSTAHSAPPHNVGEWLSLVEHLVRDQGVGGSNPLSPTILDFWPSEKSDRTGICRSATCLQHPYRSYDVASSQSRFLS